MPQCFCVFYNCNRSSSLVRVVKENSSMETVQTVVGKVVMLGFGPPELPFQVRIKRNIHGLLVIN